jgi:hypothetical protein
MSQAAGQNKEAPSGSAAATGSIDDLPDCVPVDLSSKTVGCVRKSDMQLNPGEQEQLNSPTGGLPVYDSDTQSQIIGYMSEIGFVPNTLLGRFSDLQACSAEAAKDLAAKTSVSQDCTDLLTQQGIDPRYLQPGANGPPVPST